MADPPADSARSQRADTRRRPCALQASAHCSCCRGCALSTDPTLFLSLVRWLRVLAVPCYLVHWRGYAPSSDSLEPKDGMDVGCAEVALEFRHRTPATMRSMQASMERITTIQQWKHERRHPLAKAALAKKAGDDRKMLTGATKHNQASKRRQNRHSSAQHGRMCAQALPVQRESHTSFDKPFVPPPALPSYAFLHLLHRVLLFLLPFFSLQR